MLALPASAPAQVPPFTAWLDLESAYIRAAPDKRAPVVGLLQRGDAVTVTGCSPSCDEPGAWALFGTDGALPLSVLQRGPEDEQRRALSAPTRNTYGKVREDDTPIYSGPGSGKLLQRVERDRALAFPPYQPFASRGWLSCTEGGYVSTAAIRMAHPSAFEGERAPGVMTAFVLRVSRFRDADGRPDGDRRAAKYDRFAVLSVEKGLVLTSAGRLRRSDLRLAWARPRPSDVSPGIRWIAIDLSEQTLVAYEGDRPVLATLVSTGKKDFETPRGRFHVWMKAVSRTMKGTTEAYQVDEVPYSMFFAHRVALHGTYWHDAFGFRVSHGCVNLSMSDAEWLFKWAPPAVPAGWRAVFPERAEDTLRVIVRRPDRIRSWAPETPSASAPAPTHAEERQSPARYLEPSSHSRSG
jgi:hypothetical protein